MRKEYYDTYKKLGICTSCGKNKAMENRVLCPDCIEKDNLRTRTYDKERKKFYNKRKRELCEALGVCTTCMTRDMKKGKQCLECYTKRIRKYREKQAEQGKLPRALWSEYGLCSICGEPVEEGNKLCSKHLEIARKNATHMRSFINRDTHKWRDVIAQEVARVQSFAKAKNKTI